MRETEAADPSFDTQALEVTTHVYPAHVRPHVTKHLTCQALHRGIRLSTVHWTSPTKEKVRHTSAAGMPNRHLEDAAEARIQLISQPFSHLDNSEIKAAALPVGPCRKPPSPSATIPTAHALVICPLPRRKQRRKCLRFRHHVTFSSSLASRGGTDDIPSS